MHVAMSIAYTECTSEPFQDGVKDVTSSMRHLHACSSLTSSPTRDTGRTMAKSHKPHAIDHGVPSLVMSKPDTSSWCLLLSIANASFSCSTLQAVSSSTICSKLLSCVQHSVLNTAATKLYKPFYVLRTALT